MRNILSCLFIFLLAVPVSARIGESGEMLRENQTAFTAVIKSATRLFADKEDLTSVIFIIPPETEVSVLGADSTYLRVVYGETEGFILKRHAQIKQTPFSSRTAIMPYASDDKAESQALTQQQQPQALPQSPAQAPSQPQAPLQSQAPSQSGQQSQQESRFSYLENKYGTNMAVNLAAGKIWKGMDSEMVLDSWGRPLKINRVISGNSIREEWIYKKSWLYIKDDVLFTWGPVGE
ncbi:MAG: hypothetical protein GX126_17640 [Bacteroidales bacterium]|jgi:hypothetical protein|nr:hypothetical protein [Bacteroidales bacterium]